MGGFRTSLNFHLNGGVTIHPTAPLKVPGGTTMSPAPRTLAFPGPRTAIEMPFVAGSSVGPNAGIMKKPFRLKVSSPPGASRCPSLIDDLVMVFPDPTALHGSQRSPTSSPSVSSWLGFETAAQLSTGSQTVSPSVSSGPGPTQASHASPYVSPSVSCCPVFATVGQLSTPSHTSSPSVSTGPGPTQPSHASP